MKIDAAKAGGTAAMATTATDASHGGHAIHGTELDSSTPARMDPRDLLDYVASFSADFAELAHRARFARLAALLDVVTAEARRERETLGQRDAA